MAKYATKFLTGLADKPRADYKKLIKDRKAYLERNGDGSELLIIPDSGRNDEKMFARLPDTQEATCIGNRSRQFANVEAAEGLPGIVAGWLRRDQEPPGKTKS